MELNRTGIIDRLRSGVTTIDSFNYDKLSAPPLSMIMSQYDIDRLYNIATSVRYAGNTRKKYNAIDEILKKKDFRKLGAGTNRLCYSFLHDDSFIIKVAYDSVAIHDSPAEFQNQFVLKPFCTKVFEVDPCGVVGSFERVDPITSREEFLSVWEDVFELIDGWLLSNGHIMADIGTKYFMNYGLRRGFGVVILDFPWLFEIDGNKIFCKSPDNKSETGICEGAIDFDPGFNEIYCTKCGTKYRVKQISKEVEQGNIIVKGGRKKMKVKVTVGNGRVITGQSGKSEASTSKDVPLRRPVPSIKTVPVGTTGKRQQKTTNLQPAKVGATQVKTGGGYSKYTMPNNVANADAPQKIAPQGGDRQTRPLPQRTDQSGDSRGKTTVSASIPTVNVPASEVNTDTVAAVVTPQEKAYVMNDAEMPIAVDATGNAKDNTLTEAYNSIVEELELCKSDLNNAEKKNIALSKDYDELRTQYDAEVKKHQDKCAEYDAAVNKRDKDIADLNQRLNAAISNKESLEKKLADAKNTAKVDTDAFVPIKEHEEKVADLESKLSEAEKTTSILNADIFEFCDYTLRAADHFIKAGMTAEDNFEPEPVEGVANIDATVTKLSDIRKLNEGEDDMYILVFKYEDGSLLCSTEGQPIVITSIGGISLNNIVVENDGFELLDQAVTDKYFSDEEDEPESEPVDVVEEANAEEVAEVEEDAEGVVEENAENADTGKN